MGTLNLVHFACFIGTVNKQIKREMDIAVRNGVEVSENLQEIGNEELSKTTGNPLKTRKSY